MLINKIAHKISHKITKLSFIAMITITIQAHADQPPAPPPATINNNNVLPNSNQPVVVQQCPPANQNNIYDPRVPPAGVYRSSDSTTYTTGEKKPYITDNNCNSSSSTAQPYVFTTAPR